MKWRSDVSDHRVRVKRLHEKYESGVLYTYTNRWKLCDSVGLANYLLAGNRHRSYNDDMVRYIKSRYEHNVCGCIYVRNLLDRKMFKSACDGYEFFNTDYWGRQFPVYVSGDANIEVQDIYDSRTELVYGVDILCHHGVESMRMVNKFRVNHVMSNTGNDYVICALYYTSLQGEQLYFLDIVV